MSEPSFFSDEELTSLRDAVEAAVLSPSGLRSSLGKEGDGYLRLVSSANVASAQASALLRDAITSARRNGASWEAIGNVLGVSRQAAQQRFAVTSEEFVPSKNRKVFTNVTAFNEMRLLRDEGKKGYQLVGFGVFYLIVEATEYQWEHRRMSLPGKAVRNRLLTQGWIDVGGWFPFGYFKRALLNLPAEPS